MKIIAATVSEWGRDRQTGEVMRQKMKKDEEEYKGERKRNAEHNENPGAGHCREHSESHADKQKGTHLQEKAAKLFVHGEGKQETNQLQKSMSMKKTAYLCHF